MYFICEKALKIHKYTKFTPIGAENGAEPKKSHILKIYGQFHCGIAHFQKEKDKSMFTELKVIDIIWIEQIVFVFY